jgi:putative ABC transport system ATP-binding protein
MPLLEACNIGKTFVDGRQRVDVLHEASVALEPGEVVALEGPSGSGKTTLLSILGCLLSPTTGEVRLDGVPVRARSPAALATVRRRAIGFVFQQFNLITPLTARENVEYALNLKGRRGRTARTEAARWLEAVGLDDRADFLPRDLSGGQKQRVAIARALAGDSRVVLADEPTGSLDSQTGRQILELFRQLARREGRGLLIATHDPRVRQLADRVVCLRDGRIQPA